MSSLVVSPSHLLYQRGPPRAVKVADHDFVRRAVEQRVFPHPHVKLPRSLHLMGVSGFGTDTPVQAREFEFRIISLPGSVIPRIYDTAERLILRHGCTFLYTKMQKLLIVLCASDETSSRNRLSSS